MGLALWETKANIAREILARSIKKEWLLPIDKLPAQGTLDVTSVPRDCGLLSSKELEITATDATGLVQRMAAGEWKAEEVLVAFAKRATIGHQLVR
jgi:amidase